MRVLEGLRSLSSLDLERVHGADAIESRSAVMVGVFDGVHLGHQRLLLELAQLASVHRALPTVVTFRNHPDEVLRGARTDWILSLPHRLRLLRRAGVGRVLLLDFDDALRELDARAFTQLVLASGLRTCALLLGFDSAIGKDREGTQARMTELGAEFGFAVQQGTAVSVDGQTISSTAIRAAIHRGDLALAHRMLGRWPQAFGEVVHGDGRGKGLGFPTANVAVQSLVLPPAGVYAVEVIHAGDSRLGVANLGSRPTFGEGADGPRLEVHLFDYRDDLYGAVLEVSFVARLRDERRFADVDELRQQIARDVLAARDVFRL